MKNNDLYWLSLDGSLDTHEIYPAVPQNFLTRGGVIDKKTKRILLYTSLSDAISVLSLGRKNMSGITVSVYRPLNLPKSYRIEPSLSDCPYLLKLSGKEIWSLEPITLSKIADIKIGEKTGEKEFKYGDRTLKHSQTKTEKLGIYEWTEILPEWDKKGKTMKLKRKNFGKTADKATKDKPKAREAGRVAGSALIGLGAGLGVKGIADNSTKLVESGQRTARRAARTIFNKQFDIAENKFRKKLGEGFADNPEYNKVADKIADKWVKTNLAINRVAKKIKKVTRPVSKFAKTKGGKAALIGVPTALVGTGIYVASKRKDKKKNDKKEGEK